MSAPVRLRLTVKRKTVPPGADATRLADYADSLFAHHLALLIKITNMIRPLIALLLLVSAAGAEPIAVTVQTDAPGPTISRHLYGQFAEHLGRCIYDGLWVGPESSIPNTRGIRTDIVEALRKIHIPNLRWPGGCFADDYHWRDGVGPREQRPKRINMHWGAGDRPERLRHA